MRQKKSELGPNPIEDANFVSKICFLWMIDFFRKGINHDLEMKDLYEPARSDRSQQLGDRLEREWNEELAKERNGRCSKKGRDRYNSSLLRCLIRIYFWRFAFQGSLVFVQYLICSNLQIIFLGRFITYFEPGSSMPRSRAYCYATGIVGMMMLSTLAGSWSKFALQRIGMQMRIACSSMIYRKITRLSKTSLDKTPGGQIINLLSNDVQRFDLFPSFIHILWIVPLQMVVTTFLVWEDVGVSFIAGLAALMLQTIPLQGFVSKLSARLRARIAEQTDKRIQLMSELISRIQVVKMYGWEKYFERIVAGVRATEVKFISRSCYCQGFYLSVFVFASQTTLFVTLLTLTLTGVQINAKMVYTLAAYCRVLQLLTTVQFSRAIVSSSEVLVSIRRVQEYLQLEEPPVRTADASALEIVADFETVGITAKKLSASWIRDASPPALRNLNFQVNDGQLCALVGPVGSGKSSTLQLILGELIVTDGVLDVRGKTVSYVTQEAWLFGGTVRDNILFGLPYLESKYAKVTGVCALDTDFRQLPRGDLTLVGERGTTLSGGQRARIHLARAVYRDADIYLIDDPLSAVDAKVGRQLFDKCIAGYLKGKTRILVTHHLQYLERTDTIIVLKNGTVQSQDTFDNLISADADFARSVDLGHTDDDEVESKDTLCRRSSTRKSVPTSRIPAASSFCDDSGVIADEETIAKGRMSSEVYKRYFQAGGSVCLRSAVILSLILSQASSSGVDYWLAFWTDQESVRQALNLTGSSLKASRYDVYGSLAVDATDISVRTGLDGLFTTETSLAIYAGVILSCIVFALARGLTLLRMCLNTSKTLHDRMFENLTQARMRFFNTNPAGRILNRFSKDVGGMDEVLPKILLESVTLSSAVVAALTMIISSNYWMVISVIFLAGIGILVRNCYLSTAQGVVRLEGATKSPMFSHVNYSLDGLLTVRSTGAQQSMIEEFDNRQNIHTSAWFMNFATTIAYSFYLNTVMVAFVSIVCYTFVIVDKEATGSVNVGLAVTQAIMSGNLAQAGLRESTRIIAEMVSAERVLQYTNLPREGPFVSDKGNEPTPCWPRFGAIDVRDLSLAYGAGESPVLKNINVKIGPGEKIGIVGRTGAGKSSLIAALFRLEEFEGSLTIDGTDTRTIGLYDLRSRMSIIPQEPCLFSTTLRQNLDPFNEFSDDRLWAAIDELELKAVLGSLDFEVTEGGGNLSLGERQLVSLARAVLRNNRIVVMDEASANVDSATDALIQATVRRRFADRTVITIAHRLSTVMDNDRILVLDAGRVVEFDRPYELLKNPRGHLTNMVRGTGPATAERLTRIARLSYERHRSIEVTQL